VGQLALFACTNAVENYSNPSIEWKDPKYHLRNLKGIARDFALASQDQLTGALGRGLLAV
jgi:hypothetical protein